MALLKAYTWISTETIPGGPGFLDVTHNVYTSCGVGHAQQIISVTPVDAAGVGTYIAGVTDNGLRLVKAGGGTVRLQVRGVHSVQQ